MVAAGQRSQLLFRKDTRHPVVIFAQGFIPLLQSHPAELAGYHMAMKGAVTATTEIMQAQKWQPVDLSDFKVHNGAAGWLYMFRSASGEQLAEKPASEWFFWRQVTPQEIEGAVQIDSGGNQIPGTAIRNPAYVRRY